MTSAAREGQIAEAFGVLAGSLVSDYDVVGLLHNLIDYCVDLLDVAAAGLVLRDPDGELEVIASSTEQTQLLELLQLEAGQGPCVECYRSGEVVTLNDLTSPGRQQDAWARFRAGAVSFGFVSVHAVPMQLREQTIGALNLFSTHPGALDTADAKVARALTDVATIAILQNRATRRGAQLNEQLQAALDSRLLIEQAKGVLAAQVDLDMDTAFRALRDHARSHNRNLRDVATAVISHKLDLTVHDSSKGSDPALPGRQHGSAVPED